MRKINFSHMSRATVKCPKPKWILGYLIFHHLIPFPLIHLSVQKKSPGLKDAKNVNSQGFFIRWRELQNLQMSGKCRKSVHFPCLFWLVPRHHCVCPARSASPFTHNGWKDLRYGAPRQKRRGVIRVSKRCKTFKNHWFYKVFQESGKNYASMASVYLHWS